MFTLNVFYVLAKTVLEVIEIVIWFHCLSSYRTDFVSKRTVSSASLSIRAYVPAVVAFVARLRWIMEFIHFGANSITYGAN